MNQDTVVSLATQAMTLALKVAGPMLLVGLVIGLVVSIFQADQLVSYAQNLYTSIPQMIG
jgi:flagellar biosynthetic protein FliQ